MGHVCHGVMCRMIATLKSKQTAAQQSTARAAPSSGRMSKECKQQTDRQDEAQTRTQMQRN